MPPLFLRRLVPWWLLRAINHRTNTCWTGMVLWRLGDEYAWDIREDCWDGPCGHEYDFCGRYKTGEEFRRAIKRLPEEKP